MIDYLYNPEFWTWRWEVRYLAAQSWVLPLLAALLTRHYHSTVHRRIILFVSYTLIMEHITWDADLKYLISADTNVSWYHLLLPPLYLLMTRFFADYLKSSKYYWLPWALPVAFTLLVVLNALWGDGFWGFPGKVVGLYSLTGIILCIGYFIHTLQALTVPRLELQPMFWISAGLLIYFASNLLLWVGMSFIRYDAEFFSSVYRINGAVTILLNLFFTIAIYLKTMPNDQVSVHPTPQR